jgi:hypothetical protein
LPIAFVILTLLIALFPVLTIADGFVAQSSFAALAALLMATTGAAARAADVQFAGQVTRRLGLAAAIPAIWIVIQLLPMPFPKLSHTIWINSNEALDQNIWGHISVDLGKTIEALAFYLANIAVILATILLARDHQRARRLLIVLATMTVVTVAVLLADHAFHIFVSASESSKELLGAASALGLLLSLAIGVSRFDRRDAPAGTSGRMLLLTSGGGALICLAGLAATENANLAIATAFGVTTFISVQLIRRLRLLAWATAILLATLLAAATMIVLWRVDTDRDLSPLLKFATSASTNSLAVAQRLLSDTAWTGTGAGTSGVLLPVYREFGNTMTRLPSTAATLTIELGLPMALVAFAIGVAILIKLYGGALSRGRDSSYAAAAASGVVFLVCETFCDDSLLHAGVATIGDVLVGVGLAQSVSRAE